MIRRRRPRSHPQRRPGPAPPAGGPISRAWLALVEPSIAPATRAVARRRIRGGAGRRLSLVPGSVRVEVRQASYRAQQVELRVPEVDDAAWDRLLTVAGRHGRWLVGLLSGELPEPLATALVDAGLVPESFEAQCTCRSESAGLCVHAAMAALLAADAFAVDPAGVLTLRGVLPERVRERLLARLPGGQASAAATRDPAGIDWNALVSGEQPDLPPPPPRPHDPGPPRTLPPPPPAAGLDAAELEGLAADAARRAADILGGTGDGSLELDADADLARRVASFDRRGRSSLTARSGITEEELDSLGTAWRIGGAAAVAALRRLWRPPPRALDPGIAALAHDGEVSWRMNRVASGDGLIELALGRDGLWYLLRRQTRGAHLRLDGRGAEDPRALLERGAEPPSGASGEQLPLL